MLFRDVLLRFVSERQWKDKSLDALKNNIYKLSNPKKQKKSYLKNKLSSLNEGKKIKLRTQKNNDDKFHLFLDYHFNYKRERQFLKLYISDKKTPENEIKIREASLLRDRKEIQLYGISEVEEFKLNKEKYKADFIDYFEFLVIHRKKNEKSWQHTLKHLKKITDYKPITFAQVTRKFAENFKNYLEQNLAPNTAHVYFSKFKTALNHAIQDGILDKASPAQFLTIKKQKTMREFLDENDINALIQTPCMDEQTKRAFLFACFSGLRISDIKKLSWNEIKNGYLHFRQKKTNDPLRIKLPKTALKLLEMQKNEREIDLIFNLIPSENKINKHIKRWALEAGITKHITFHSARHTFATLLLNSGVDVFTVKEYLGHQDVKVTQIYAKLIDKEKDKAIDLLPDFDI